MGWHNRASNVVWALALASRVGSASGVVVEAATVSNVIVDSFKWDLRSEAQGGCGIEGCDPRLTRDGKDNTVADSRWSCDSTNCYLNFQLDISSFFFTFSHLVIYFHESDDESKVAVRFEVDIGYDTISGVTSPGTALGTGERVNIPADASGTDVDITFDLSTDQWIHVSEVQIYVDVEDPDAMVIPELETTSVVNAKTVTNVVASAPYWDLNVDAGCGAAGCSPPLASDGNDNTVAASRWSCDASEDYVWSTYNEHRCFLSFNFDEYFTVSYIMLYVHESDDAAKPPISFEVYSCTSVACSFTRLLASDPTQIGSFVTVPGTALGEGERFNLPRPFAGGIAIYANLSAEQYVDISEVEVYLEVTETNVMVPAAEAWIAVTADTLTEVVTSARESIGSFLPSMTRDGDDNTVVSSRWSCDATGDDGSCTLFFGFQADYTISYLILYVHESDDATKAPIDIDFYDCDSSTVADNGFRCNFGIVGSYVTRPGTPLGEGERINLLRPTQGGIGLNFPNASALQTIDISEVEIFLEAPDSTPTPAPFVSSSDTSTLTSPLGGATGYDDDNSVVASPTTTSSAGTTDDSDDTSSAIVIDDDSDDASLSGEASEPLTSEGASNRRRFGSGLLVTAGWITSVLILAAS